MRKALIEGYQKDGRSRAATPGVKNLAQVGKPGKAPLLKAVRKA